jgi:hypothetical protein
MRKLLKTIEHTSRFCFNFYEMEFIPGYLFFFLAFSFTMPVLATQTYISQQMSQLYTFRELCCLFFSSTFPDESTRIHRVKSLCLSFYNFILLESQVLVLIKGFILHVVISE